MTGEIGDKMEHITKRELFAALALQGLISQGSIHTHRSDYIIGKAIQLADQLIDGLEFNPLGRRSEQAQDQEIDDHLGLGSIAT